MSKFIKIGENRIAVDSIALYYPKDNGTQIDFKISGNQSKSTKANSDVLRVFRSGLFIPRLDVKKIDDAITELSIHESVTISEIELPAPAAKDETSSEE